MITDIQLFLDMDGPIVDLDGYFFSQFGTALHDMTKEERELHWDEHFTVDWFLHAPPAKDAFELLEYCLTNYRYVRILTALPHRRRDKAWQSMEAKIQWVHQHIGYNLPITFGPYAEDKRKHCNGMNYVLIDAMQRNIKQWLEAGGYGIFHTAAEFTIEELKVYEKVRNKRSL